MKSLNPCFSGCNLKLAAEFNLYVPGMGLNPCFSGCNLKFRFVFVAIALAAVS